MCVPGDPIVLLIFDVPDVPVAIVVPNVPDVSLYIMGMLLHFSSVIHEAVHNNLRSVSRSKGKLESIAQNCLGTKQGQTGKYRPELQQGENHRRS